MYLNRYLSSKHRLLSDSREIKCSGGYVERGKCTCDEGKYPVQQNSYYSYKCQSCTTNCYSCESSNSCEECQDGYFVSKGKCIKCDSTCDTCEEQSKCITCAKNLYLTTQSKCVDCNTNMKYYVEQSTKMCKNCDQSCQSCIDGTASKCTKCATGYQKSPPANNLSSTTFNCVQCDTQNGFFISGSTCSKCHLSCQTCNGSLETNCLICKDGKILEENSKKCMDCSKNSGYYLKSSNLCAKCDQNCLTCENSSSQCTSCSGSFSLKDKTCVDCSKQIGYYKNSQNKCIKCDSTCQTCESSDKCLICASSYYWDEQRKNCIKCDTSNGFFVKDDQCLKCHNNCDQCNSKENNNISCQVCKSGYDWVQSAGQPIGVQECGVCDKKKGFYRDSGTCKKCQDNCAECELQGSVLECKKCSDNFYFDGDSVTTCVSCSNGKYVEQNLKCKDCHSTCKKCFNGTEQGCEICADTHRRFEQEKKCVLCNQEGFIKVSTDRCEKCIGNCNQCEPSNLAKCISCKATFFLKDNGKCEACTENNYIDGIYCKPCDKSCNQCESANPAQCKACAVDYLKDNPSSNSFKCIKCPQTNYFNQGGVCTQCDSSCFQCNGPLSNNCTSCYSGHNQASGVCASDCNGVISAKCPCHSKCKYCKDPYVGAENKEFACTACESNYYLMLKPEFGADYYSCNECLSSDGLFKNGTFCEKCSLLNCKECFGNIQGQCNICSENYFLSSIGECVKCDQPGQTIHQGKCYECPLNCLKCSYDSQSHSTICEKCKADLKLNEQKECINCPVTKYFIQDEYCLPCYPTCATCEGGNLEKHCKTCESGLFFIDQKCQQCPPLNYALIDITGGNKECVPCHKSCSKCNNIGEQNCTLCLKDLYFFNENSQNYCRECKLDQGYFIENNTYCKKCDSPCLTCNGAGGNQCNSCIQDYALYQGRTCQLCDQTNKKYLNEKQLCLDCDPTCQTCSGPEENQCKSCPTGKYLYPDGTCGECDEVVENVMRKDNKCFKCHNSCSEGCNTTDETGCKKCQIGLSFIKKNGTDRVCEKCPSQNFYEQNQECLSCHSSCHTCEGGQENECIECKQSLSFMNDDRCDNCPQDFFYVDNTNTCSDCPINCQKCDNSQSCIKCKDGYQIDPSTKQCVQCQSKSGFFIYEGQCFKCHPACKECTGPSDLECIDCTTNYYRINGSQQCAYCQPTKEYKEQKKNCVVCENICSLCGIGSQLPFQVQQNQSFLDQLPRQGPQSSLYCTECKCKACMKGFYSFKGLCVSECNQIGENYTYDKITKECKCKDQYRYEIFEVFTKGKQKYCSKIIPNGFFCNPNDQCQECSPNCHTCKDQVQCSYCNEGFFLWQGKCFKNCPNNHNLIENKQKRICECPEGYVYKILKNQKEGMCVEPLKLQTINIENSFMSQRDDYMKDEKVQITTYNNILKFIFNRDLLDDEKQNFDIFVNIESLSKDKDYFIKNIYFIDNTIISEIEVVKNQRALSITYSFNGQNQTIRLKNAILTTSSYNKSQVGQKDTSANLQSMSAALTPKNGKSKDMLDFLKKFQLLCFLSNFVQVLGPITLFKDNIPPLVYVGAELGASFIFSEVPSSHEIGYSPETDNSASIAENQIQYDEINTQPSPYSIMHGMGLKQYLYSNFMMVHIILDISSLTIMIFLIARKIHPGKQYSLLIVDKFANQIVSYLQGSITSTLFCIVYSLYFSEGQGLAIFQILIILLLLIEIAILAKNRSQTYISMNLPNFFENINPRAFANKSYIVVSFLKKYFVISVIIGLCPKPATCSILIATVFFCNGAYILKYRFFENKIINICKIVQEWFIGLLFCILMIVIRKYSDILGSSEILDEDLLNIEKYSFVTIIFFLICLTASLLIFIIRLIIQIYQIIKNIQMKRSMKQNQKEIECESLQQLSKLNDTQLYSQQISSKLLRVTLNSSKTKEYQKHTNKSPVSTEADL